MVIQEEEEEEEEEEEKGNRITTTSTDCVSGNFLQAQLVRGVFGHTKFKPSLFFLLKYQFDFAS
jgi:hypothetical protein